MESQSNSTKKSDSAKESGSGSSEDSGDKSSGFGRGERQKQVTKSYRKNWDDAFGNKPNPKNKK